jgi:uncharacterized membrane protein
MPDLLVVLTVVTAAACGLNAGFFFAFSSVVMRALARLQPAAGVAAMQAINVSALTAPLMIAMVGTAAACLAVAGWGVAEWDEPFAPYLVAGSTLFLAGPIGLTIAYHVPRNDALATAAPQSSPAADLWARYQREWTPWNHVRAAAAEIPDQIGC